MLNDVFDRLMQAMIAEAPVRGQADLDLVSGKSPHRARPSSLRRDALGRRAEPQLWKKPPDAKGATSKTVVGLSVLLLAI
uniref:hypothetical protein n=1 Tax=Nonomuraea bangladeshensis TaxID=404385 RepID=UPI003F4917D6